MYRVLTMKWQSSIDTGTSFLNGATSYRAFKYTNFNQTSDYEESNLRFWRREINKHSNDNRPHKFNFVVWKESVSSRYFREMMAFAVQVITLTFLIAYYNDYQK